MVWNVFQTLKFVHCWPAIPIILLYLAYVRYKYKDIAYGNTPCIIITKVYKYKVYVNFQLWQTAIFTWLWFPEESHVFPCAHCSHMDKFFFYLYLPAFVLAFPFCIYAGMCSWNCAMLLFFFLGPCVTLCSFMLWSWYIIHPLQHYYFLNVHRNVWKKLFLSWSQLVKTGGRDRFFKCEHGNARL